jgi:hypothetical protein
MEKKRMSSALMNFAPGHARIKKLDREAAKRM